MLPSADCSRSSSHAGQPRRSARGVADAGGFIASRSAFAVATRDCASRFWRSMSSLARVTSCSAASACDCSSRRQFSTHPRSADLATTRSVRRCLVPQGAVQPRCRCREAFQSTLRRIKSALRAGAVLGELAQRSLRGLAGDDQALGCRDETRKPRRQRLLATRKMARDCRPSDQAMPLKTEPAATSGGNADRHP